jgi:hypothetical protein
MDGRPSRPSRDHRPRIDDSTWIAAAALALLLTIGFVLYKSEANRSNSVVISQQTRAPSSSVSR